MTEKRFDYEFGNDGYYIIDKEKIGEYDESFIDKMEYREYTIENSLSGYEVVDLLNSLSKENEQLKYDNEALKGVFESYRSISEHTQKELREENEQLRKLLREAEDEIETLKKSNQSFMESLVNKESEDEDNQETEVRECSFCGEFRTDYQDPDCYGGWTSKDFCNAGHDLEDTDPNSCKDYWDNF